MVDGALYGRLTPERLETLVAKRIEKIGEGLTMAGPIKIFVPCDAAAISVGADETAAAIADEASQRNIESPDHPQWVTGHVMVGAFG